MKVLLIVIDPRFNDKKLSEHYNVNVLELHSKVLKEWSTISGELYTRLPEVIYSNDLPAKEDGYQYNSQEYFDVLFGGKEHHSPDYLNYTLFVDKFDLVARRNNYEFDEVHLYGAPWMGAFESRIIGRNSFWCNSPGYNANCSNFLLMGFNYERGVSEAVEAFGHRVESTLRHYYPSFFNDFTKSVGSIHIPHNATRDYDWTNKNLVECFADIFPGDGSETVSSGSSGCNLLLSLLSSITHNASNVPGNFQSVSRNCEYWKCNSLDYFRYWFSHIPQKMWKPIITTYRV